MKPDFPALIDNTMRGTFVECPQKWWNSFVLNRTIAKPSVHLHAGGAFAAGLEATRGKFYGEGWPEQDAIAFGLMKMWEFYGTFEPDEKDKHKDWWHLSRAFVAYFNRYKLPTDYLKPVIIAGKPLVEFTFALPIDVAHPQTNDPILYGGRFDMFANHAGYNVNFVSDEKTSAQLGNQWLKQWDTAAQFTGYIWASRQMGLNPAGAIVRGIGLLMTETTFLEAITYRDAWRVEQWYKQLCRDVRRMIVAWETGVIDKAEDHACTNYGGCLYTPVCFHRKGEEMLESHLYAPRNWNPLAKDPSEQKLGWRE